MSNGEVSGRPRLYHPGEGPFIIVGKVEDTPGDPQDGVRRLVEQSRAALGHGLYYPALMGALALPDICGALGSENGRSSGTKTIAWLKEFAGYSDADAALIWGFRCSLLHQGSSRPHRHELRVAFAAAGAHLQLHKVETAVGEPADVVFWLELADFVDEMGSAALRWLEAHGSSARVQRHLEAFARYRPGGLPPHYLGAPVIA